MVPRVRRAGTPDPNSVHESVTVANLSGEWFLRLGPAHGVAFNALCEDLARHGHPKSYEIRPFCPVDFVLLGTQFDASSLCLVARDDFAVDASTKLELPTFVQIGHVAKVFFGKDIHLGYQDSTGFHRVKVI